MSTMLISCPACGQQCQIGDSLGGQDVQCPACQQIIRLVAARPKPARNRTARHILVFLVIVSILTGGAVIAILNSSSVTRPTRPTGPEWSGFRGISWGTDLRGRADVRFDHEECEGVKVYRFVKDEATVGKLRIWDFELRTVDDRFYEGSYRFHYSDNDLLRDALSAKYGQPQTDKFDYVFWQGRSPDGHDVSIFFDLSPPDSILGERSSVTVKDEALASIAKRRQESAHDRKARDAAKDL